MSVTSGTHYQCIQCGKLFQVPRGASTPGWKPGNVSCPDCGGGWFNVLPAEFEPQQPHGNPFYRDDPRDKERP